MNTAAKLTGFAILLATVFGASAVAGSVVDQLQTGDPEAGGHEGEMEIDVQTVRGLAVSEHGLTLDLARRTGPVDQPFQLDFQIADRSGRTVRDFDIEHTKPMHLIVVRRDLTGFQHLHPTQTNDGGWTVPLTLPTAGSYRVFADFSVDGTPYTLAGDLQVDGSVDSHELPAPVKSVDVDGLKVHLGEEAIRPGAESALAFTVTRDGREVGLQDYLGAKGHLVTLRQGDLAFLHVHPDADRLRFETTFPSAASYGLFLQFKVDGRVYTAAFTQDVSR